MQEMDLLVAPGTPQADLKRRLLNEWLRNPLLDEDPHLLMLGNPELRLVNYANLVGTTSPVGQHADGASPYGILNMAGNVMEWTARDMTQPR